MRFESDAQRRAVFATIREHQGPGGKPVVRVRVLPYNPAAIQSRRRRQRAELLGAGAVLGFVARRPLLALGAKLIGRSAAIGGLSKAAKTVSAYSDKKMAARVVRRGVKRATRILNRKTTTAVGEVYLSKRGRIIFPSVAPGGKKLHGLF